MIEELKPCPEMVEKVARAIRDVTQGEGFDYMDFCRDAARAAITAYDPDKRLIEALEQAREQILKELHEKLSYPTEACAVVRAAALSHNGG